MRCFTNPGGENRNGRQAQENMAGGWERGGTEGLGRSILHPFRLDVAERGPAFTRITLTYKLEFKDPVLTGLQFPCGRQEKRSGRGKNITGDFVSEFVCHQLAFEKAKSMLLCRTSRATFHFSGQDMAYFDRVECQLSSMNQIDSLPSPSALLVCDWVNTYRG
jgi:hypothetical protein